MVGRTGTRAEESNVPTTPRSASLHPQAGWEAATARNTCHPRPGDADGGSRGSRTIFEADLQPEQYAYRQDRSALDAVKQVHGLIQDGHQEIVDADLSTYFDSIPHAELMKTVAPRHVDRAMLHLNKKWVGAPGEKTRVHG